MTLREFRSYLRERARDPETFFQKKVFPWLYRVISDYTSIQAWGLWIAAVVTGLVAIGYARLFRVIEAQFDSLLQTHPLICVFATPVAFLMAWVLVYRFAPEAGGSGIPQVIAAVEEGAPKTEVPFVERILSLKTAVVKVLSSLICLLGGGAIGREGPTLQVSASIFHWFGRHVRKYYPQADQQTWIIAGSAAGLASAFNTPLGGIVYAIEELAATHFHRVRTALLTSVIISGLIAQTILGSYLYLGYPVLQPMSAKTWPLIILTGFVSGLFGALFSKALLYLLSKKSKVPARLGLIAIACGVGAAFLNYIDTRTAGPGSGVIAQILFEGRPATWTLTFTRMAATALAYLSGAAGGVFSPSLTIGACIGSKIAYLFGSANVNLLAMLGMIGFLTGLTHTPFTAFILVVEMSDRHSALLPMMLAAVVAHGVAKSLQSRSFYEEVKEALIKRETEAASVH